MTDKSDTPVKRYDTELRYIGTGEYLPTLKEAIDGEVVLYDDHLAALANLERENRELAVHLRELREENERLKAAWDSAHKQAMENGEKFATAREENRELKILLLPHLVHKGNCSLFDNPKTCSCGAFDRALKPTTEGRVGECVCPAMPVETCPVHGDGMP